MPYYPPRQIDFNDLGFHRQQQAFHEFQRLDPLFDDPSPIDELHAQNFDELCPHFQEQAFHEFQRLDQSLQDMSFDDFMKSNNQILEGPDDIPWTNIQPY